MAAPIQHIGTSRDWSAKQFLTQISVVKCFVRNEISRSIRHSVDTGECTYRQNRDEMKQWDANFEDKINPEIHSIIDVPFAGGTLAINSTEENAFGEREVEVLQRLAEVVSGAFMRTQDFRALSREVEERKRAEEGLKRQREILKTIFDSIPIMIILYDAGGKILLINQEVERVLGWSFADMRNIDLLSTYSPDSDERREVQNYAVEGTPTWREVKTQVRSGATLDTTWMDVQLQDGTSISIGQEINKRK